jgi:hypothetical protein
MVVALAGCGFSHDGLNRGSATGEEEAAATTGSPDAGRDLAPAPKPMPTPTSTPTGGTGGSPAPAPGPDGGARPDMGTGGAAGGSPGTGGSSGGGGSMGVGGPGNGWVGGPAIVAVGYGGRRVVSREGASWTGDVQDLKTTMDVNKMFQDVAYGNGLVVAVGGSCNPTCAGRIATYNGAGWTEVMLPAGTSWLGAVAYGGGTWVAAGAAGPALTSADGKRWTPGKPVPGNVHDLAYGNVGGANAFVAVGDNGLRVRSTDGGATWINAAQTFPGTDAPVTLGAVAIGNGVVVAAGAGGRRIRSKNGMDWIDVAAGGTNIGSVLFVEGRFMAYADNGVVFLSTDDGHGWSPQTELDPPGDSVASGPLGSGRLWVGVAWPATIKTSSNGIAWTLRVKGDDQNPLVRFAFAGY